MYVLHTDEQRLLTLRSISKLKKMSRGSLNDYGAVSIHDRFARFVFRPNVK